MITRTFYEDGNLVEGRCSAKHLAATIVENSVEETLEFWTEKYEYEFNQMTAREKEEVSKHLENYARRLSKLLGKYSKYEESK